MLALNNVYGVSLTMELVKLGIDSKKPPPEGRGFTVGRSQKAAQWDYGLPTRVESVHQPVKEVTDPAAVSSVLDVGALSGALPPSPLTDSPAHRLALLGDPASQPSPTGRSIRSSAPPSPT